MIITVIMTVITIFYDSGRGCGTENCQCICLKGSKNLMNSKT